jgi:hypothetical protein
MTVELDHRPADPRPRLLRWCRVLKPWVERKDPNRRSSRNARQGRFDDCFNIQLTLELFMSDYTLFSEHMTSLLDYSRGGGKPYRPQWPQ